MCMSNAMIYVKARGHPPNLFLTLQKKDVSTRECLFIRWKVCHAQTVFHLQSPIIRALLHQQNGSEFNWTIVNFALPRGSCSSCQVSRWLWR